jgi:hypothetical protein
MFHPAVLFVCVAWPQFTTSPRIGHPAPVVDAILHADLTPEARMKALEPFLNIGMGWDDAERALGKPGAVFGNGPGFSTLFFWHASTSVHMTVGCYPDGEIYRLTYTGKDGKSVVLQSDKPVTWPKTTDGHNAKLREWKNRQK